MSRGRLPSLLTHAAVALAAGVVGGLVVRLGSPAPRVFQTFRVTSDDGAAAAVLQAGVPAADRRIDAALAERVDPATLGEMPLSQFVAWLSQQSGLTVSANWHALELQGVDRDTKLNLAQAVFGTIDLKHLADFACNLVGGGFAELALVRREGGLLLTTKEDADRHLETRFYEVGDLLVATNRAANRLNAWLAVPPARWNYDGYDRRVNAPDWLAELVMSQLATDTWQDNGGTTGFLKQVGGVLVIRQTPEVHREIARLLDALRVAHHELDELVPPPPGQTDASLLEAAREAGKDERYPAGLLNGSGGGGGGVAWPSEGGVTGGGVLDGGEQ